MRQALAILYSRIVIETLVVVGILALIVGRIRRRLRVSPRQRTRAPMLWLVNITADARLHRRLRNLAAELRRAARGGPRHRQHRHATSAQRLALDLEGEVIVLDERLVDSRALDFDAQRAVITTIRSDADRIEALTPRVTTLVEIEESAPDLDLTGDRIGAITSRIERLEATVRSNSATATQTPVVIEVVAQPRELDSPR